MNKFLVLLFYFFSSTFCLSQFPIDSSFSNNFNYLEFAVNSDGITELHFCPQGIIMNQGADGYLNLLLPQNEIKEIWKFEQTIDPNGYFHEPSLTNTRNYKLSENESLNIVTKENDFQYSNIQNYHNNAQWSRITKDTSIRSFIYFDIEEIAPHDLVYSGNDDYYIYSKSNMTDYTHPNFLCKYNDSTKIQSCIEINLEALRFFQNNLLDVFFIDKHVDYLYRLNSDLSHDTIMALENFIDLQIYDNDKLILAHANGFDIYSNDLLNRLDQIQYELEEITFSTHQRNIYINNAGTITELDSLLNEKLLYQNNCPNEHLDNIALNNDQIFIYGGKENVIHLKYISQNAEDNIQQIPDATIELINTPKIHASYGGAFGEFNYTYKLELSLEIIVKNEGESPITQLLFNINRNNKLRGSPVHLFEDLNIGPSQSDTLIFKLNTNTSKIQSTGLFTHLDEDLPSIFDLELLQVNNLNPCQRINIEIPKQDFNICLPEIDNDEDGFNDEEDCNDADNTIYPGAPELCDGIDNNCNNQIDEGLETQTYYADNDQDGFGAGEGFLECAQLDFTSTNNEDCDDENPIINPNALDQYYDGIDHNCDGVDGPSANFNHLILNIEVYPNPSSDIVQIKSDYSSLNYQLLSLDGRKVMEGKLKEVINIKDLNKGLYILKLWSDETQSTTVKQIIKY